MALPTARGDREYQKFVDTADGPAVRTTSKINVENVNLSAEMKVDSGHDLYLAENVTRTADLAVSFDAITTTFTLAELQAVENKTKGWVYSTKGATLTSTSITLLAASQSEGYPVIASGDVIEVVYRGASRLTDGTQISNVYGVYNTTEPSLSDGDLAQLQLNDKGQLKVTGGASSVTAQYTSPSSFTATYTSSTTLTLSALSGFSITDSSQLVYIKVIPASGDAAIYVNGSDGVTMTVSSNVVTIAGAGTPFASGDVYEVGINALPFELDASTQSMKTSSLTNVWNQYTHPQTIVTAQDLTAAYADFGPEIDMRGFTHLSVYIITDVNDSENVTLKLLGKHTSAGTDEFELNGGTTQALWTTGASDSKVQYEFNVKGTPFIQLQSIAGTTGYTPAYLTGGSSAEGNFGTWAAVTDGSFRITIDGTARNIDAIDFSGDGSMADVAATIQAAIRAATGSTETCVWSTDHFIISSVLDASTSAITVTSTSTGTVGTDISGAGAADWMDCDSGNGTVTALAGTIGDLTISITKIWKGE
jgi:hypothetical protein